MVNIYNIRILKLPKGRHDVCESSRVLISHSFFGVGGWVRMEEEVGDCRGVVVQKRMLRKKAEKKGKEFDREKCTLTLIYQYFGQHLHIMLIPGLIMLRILHANCFGKSRQIRRIAKHTLSSISTISLQ